MSSTASTLNALSTPLRMESASSPSELHTLTAALALGGCASNPSRAQVGTGVGAVVGGVAGNAIFGGPVGTIGGAAAGALIGHEIGEDRDQRRYRRR